MADARPLRVDQHARDSDTGLLAVVAIADQADDLSLVAGTTLTMELACRGWPLVRRDVDEGAAHADAGLAPEALARRVDVWLGEAREAGWHVPADLPRPRTTL